MGKKEQFIDKSRRDDILLQLDDIEKKSGNKMDEDSREAIVRAVSGFMSDEAAKLELKLRGARKEYIINRRPSSGLEACLSGLSVTALRDMVDFIIHMIVEAQPPKDYITYVSRNRNKPGNMAEIIIMAKIAYSSDLDMRKKKDLVADAYGLLSDRSVVEHIMLGMTPQSRKDFGEAVKDSSNCSLYAVSYGLMFLFGGKKSDGYSPLSYIVPDEIKDIWLSLPQTAICRYDTLADYAAAAANLYGVIPGKELLYLIRRYDTPENNDPETVSLTAMTDSELLDAINLRTFDDECSFQFHSDKLINELYIVSEKYLLYLDNMLPDIEDYGDHLYSKIKVKPRYFPSKNEFLKYSDPHYYEQTPESAALRTYIRKKYGKQLDRHLKQYNKENEEFSEPVTLDRELDDIMEALHDFFVSDDSDFEDMAAVLRVRDVDIGDTGELFKHISAARVHTRTWFNKGYFYDDGLIPNSVKDLQMQIFGPEPETDEPDEEDKDDTYRIPSTRDIVMTDTSIPFKADVKPGRNDLCSCGSGKKYKKCCGR